MTAKHNSKSEAIRSLGREGLAVAEIARRVGVRYQFARNVLAAAGMIKVKRSKASTIAGTQFSASTSSAIAAKAPERAKMPELTGVMLAASGFEHSSRWLLSKEGVLILERPLPRTPGVYSFVKNGVAQYVGLATMGLAKRCYFYSRPGSTQRTSQRINELLSEELRRNSLIDVYTATPPDLSWKGLPVSGVAGLELGLIEHFWLPWNLRGVRS